MASHRRGIHLGQGHSLGQQRSLALRPVGPETRCSARARCASAPSIRAVCRSLRALGRTSGVQVEQLTVEAVPDRSPHVLLDPAFRGARPDAVVVVSRGLGDARDDQRRERGGLRRGGLCVADPDLDRAERQVGTDRPPNLRVLDDRTRAHQEVDVLGEARQLPNASGTPQRGKLLVKICERTLCRPTSRPSRNGEFAEIASSDGSTGRRRSHTRTARSAPRMPT